MKRLIEKFLTIFIMVVGVVSGPVRAGMGGSLSGPSQNPFNSNSSLMGDNSGPNQDLFEDNTSTDQDNESFNPFASDATSDDPFSSQSLQAVKEHRVKDHHQSVPVKKRSSVTYPKKNVPTSVKSLNSIQGPSLDPSDEMSQTQSSDDPFGSQSQPSTSTQNSSYNPFANNGENDDPFGSPPSQPKSSKSSSKKKPKSSFNPFSLNDQGPAGSKAAGLKVHYNTITPIVVQKKPKSGEIDGSAVRQSDYFDMLCQAFVGTTNPFSSALNPQATSYKNLLLQVFQYYWEFTREKGRKGPSGQSFPANIGDALEGNPGPFYFMAFMSTSYPSMLLNEGKTTLLYFIKERLNQLNEHFYQCETAENFFRGAAGGKTPIEGELAKVNKIWSEIEKIYNDAWKQFTLNSPTVKDAQALKAWTKKTDEELVAVFEDFEHQRNAMLINWYFKLLKELSSKYNESNYLLKNFSYQVIPNVAVLEGYLSLIQQSFTALMASNKSFSFGPYKFDAKGSAKGDNTVPSLTGDVYIAQTFTDSTAFKNLFNNFINEKMATLSYFAAMVGFDKAQKLSEGKILPDLMVQGDPLTGNYQDTAYFATYNPAEPVGDLEKRAPLTAESITAYPKFNLLQNQFQYVSSFIEDVMGAFGFDINNYVVWSERMGYSAFVPLKSVEIGDDPQKVLKKELENAIAAQTATDYSKELTEKQLEKTDGNKKSSNTAAQIFESLVLSARGFYVAADYSEKLGNRLNAQKYKEFYQLLGSCITYFHRAVTAYEASLQAKDFITGTTGTTQGQFLHAAQLDFGKASDAFQLLEVPELVVYARKLAAQLALERYQSVTAGYVSYYQPYVTDYITIAQQKPFIPDEADGYRWQVNENYNGRNITEYQNFLDDIFKYFDSMLDDALSNYQEELAFYFALKKPNNKQNEQAIAELQAALKVFNEVKEAFYKIYHCKTGSDGTLICQPGDDLSKINECLATADSVTQTGTSQCFGADNYIERATKGTLQDVIGWVTFATSKYLQAHPHFEEVDTLFKKYSKELKNYTQLQKLFQDSQGQEINMSNFFYLHQAHLYMSIGQRLYLGQDWKGKKIRDVSPVCMLLFLWSRALYKKGGFLIQSQDVDSIVNRFLKKYPNEGESFAYEAVQSAEKMLTESSVDKAQVIFEETLAYFTTAYELGETAVIDDFLTFISSDIVPPVQASNLTESTKKKTFYEAVKNQGGFVEWVEQHKSDLTYPSLLELSAYYRGYLLALKSSNEHADTFLSKAKTALTQMYAQRAKLYQAAKLVPGRSVTQTEYETKETALQQLIELDNRINGTKLFLELYRSVLNMEHAEDLSWETQKYNMHSLLGNLYTQNADNQLKQAQESFAQGTTFGSQDTQQYENILAEYKKASEQYAMANDQKNFAKTQLGITNTIAFQSYSSIFPVNQFDLKGITLKNDAADSDITTDLAAPDCGTTVTVQDAMKNYNANIPLYLLAYKEEVVPSNMGQITKPLAGKTDVASMKEIAQKIAIPMYRAKLNSQLGGVGDLDTYVTNYQNQLMHMIETGVTACGKKIHAKLFINTIMAEDNAGNKVPQYYLQQNNTPLNAFPRFTGDQDCAYTKYSLGALKLYGPGPNPIKFGGRMLVPSNNIQGVALVKKALLNTYLAHSVPAGAQIQQLQKGKAYTDLVKLTQAERVTATLTDAQKTLKANLENDFIGLSSIYLALQKFVETFGKGQGVVYAMLANTYLEWTKTKVPFLIGDPTDKSFESSAAAIGSYANEVSYYAQYLKEGQTLISEAQQVFINAILDVANYLEVTPETKQTIQYSTDGTEKIERFENATTFPLSVPNFDKLNKWKEAWKYYIIIEQQIEAFLKEPMLVGMSFPTIEGYLPKIRVKMAKALGQLGIYYLSLFGYNTYQQCLCKLNNTGIISGASPASFLLIYGKDYTGSSAQTEIKAMSAAQLRAATPQSYNMWEVETASTKNPPAAGFPFRLFSNSGQYPKLTTTKNKYGDTIFHCPKPGTNVYPFGLTTFGPKSENATIFQGVASIPNPTAQTIIQGGQVGSEEVGMQSFLDGSGAGSSDDAIGAAYKILQDSLLYSIYYFEQVMTVLGKLGPKLDLNKKKATQVKVTPSEKLITFYVASILSKSPAFTGSGAITENAPNIVVQATKTNKQKGKKAVAMSYFKQIEDFATISTDTESFWHKLSLSSPSTIYPQTVQYWLSTPQAGPDMLNQYLDWIEPPTASTDTATRQTFFEAAATWINDLSFVARYCYWQNYLPGQSDTAANSAIDNQISNLSNNLFIQASEYVG